MNRHLRIAVAYFVMSFALAGVVLLQWFPLHPDTWLEWIALFVLVLPVTIVGESLGELLLRNRFSRAVAQRTQYRSFSWLRIAFMLLLVLPMFAGLITLSICLSA